MPARQSIRRLPTILPRSGPISSTPSRPPTRVPIANAGRSTLPSMNHWLIKSEPDVFSIHDLAHAKARTTHWEGVRNYQARNFLRAMKKGDRALYYHSNATPSAVAGTVEIVREAYPDPTAWNPKSDYHDPKASADNPIWSMVDVRLVEIFAREVPLEELRGVAALKGMELLRRGSRLSVHPVTKEQFEVIVRLAARPPESASRKTAARPARGRA